MVRTAMLSQTRDLQSCVLILKVAALTFYLYTCGLEEISTANSSRALIKLYIGVLASVWGR